MSDSEKQPATQRSHPHTQQGLVAKWMTGDTDSTLIQLFRYTFVGGLAFIVDFAMLYLLTEFGGFHYLVSAAFAFLAGLTTNYILSTLWVFSRRSLENRWAEFAVFAVIGLIGLGLNEVAMWFFTEVGGLHYMVSKAVSTVIVYFWNFFARKFLLFR